MNDEIIDLLSKEENIEALFTIGDNLNNVKNHLINSIFIPQLTLICSEYNLILDAKIYDRVNTPWSSFIISNPRWKYFNIGFEFEAKGLRALISGVFLKDKNIRNEEAFNNLKTRFRKSNQRWAWSDFPIYSSWEKDAMLAIKNGEMINIFRNEIENILKVTEGLDM